MEAGEDDDDEEKKARAEAELMLRGYEGDIWRAAAEGSIKHIRAYLLTSKKGVEAVLGLHNSQLGEGGRTLLHTAAWNDSPQLVELLLQHQAAPK